MLSCSVDDDASPFGPLTQRLVQGLLEENLIAPLDDTCLMSEAGQSVSLISSFTCSTPGRLPGLRTWSVNTAAV